jgi:hypothetical protein
MVQNSWWKWLALKVKKLKKLSQDQTRGSIQKKTKMKGSFWNQGSFLVKPKLLLLGFTIFALKIISG